MVSFLSTTTTVAHDKGLFEFEVDRRWSQNLDEDGTQVLWDDSAGSGTLRVTSLTAKRRFESNVDAVRGALSAGRSVEIRSDGVGIVAYRQESTENGRPTTMFWWEAAHAVPPEYVRMAFFSFTIFSDEEDDPKTKRQLDLLRKYLPQVRFGPLQDFEK